MQNETAGTAFKDYGIVYKTLSEDKRNSLLCQTFHISSQRSVSQFLLFSCNAYLELLSGAGILLVSTDPENGKIDEFPMSQRIQLRPNVYFGFIAATPELAVNVYVDTSCSFDTLNLFPTSESQSSLPSVRISSLLGYCYRIRTPGCRFPEETHDFFELTYVDTGILHTDVNGIRHTLAEKEMIIYGPGQHHRQSADDTQSVSYVTVQFRMENLNPNAEKNWYEILLNKVHPYSKKTHTLMKTLVQESAAGVPYTDSLMLCLLTETVIRLLQSCHIASATAPAGIARQNYRDELFERINNYIESKICEPLTVAEICQQFSISRSSLQLLFKNTVDQSPKKYISDMKLEKSRQMLRENKYTVSEISLKLGYSSIHYFSNSFTQKYHISPSEYAKRIY
ncbi:MAG: helix-turn-helix domain-containing protein [Oscillospiraceae bacterium]|nr:helix-turn-helix domain-containing protein [Oscillospiraceae bacterium]